MALLFNKETKSDFYIIDKNGIKLFLHKNILMNKLEYFNNLFDELWIKCNFMTVDDIKIYYPIFEYIYKDNQQLDDIFKYNLTMYELNDLILYADKIGLLGDNNFRTLMISLLEKVINIDEIDIIPSELLYQGIVIIANYNTNKDFDKLIQKVIEGIDYFDLIGLFEYDIYRKNIINNDIFVKLIITIFNKHKDRNIFNELLRVKDTIRSIMISSNDILNFFVVNFGKNIRHIMYDDIYKFYPLTITYDIVIINMKNIKNFNVCDNEIDYYCFKQEDFIEGEYCYLILNKNYHAGDIITINDEFIILKNKITIYSLYTIDMPFNKNKMMESDICFTNCYNVAKIKVSDLDKITKNILQIRRIIER